MAKKEFKTVVDHLKNNGFVYQSSEIYGGLANTWDFGPLGVVVKNQIKNLWWREFVDKDQNIYGLDSSVILNNSVWQASGHIDTFSDPLVDCKECKKRYRADKLIELDPSLSNEDIDKLLIEKEVKCPNCGKSNFTDVRQFNLMFEVNQNITSNAKDSHVYLRPETAQGIFINFKNVLRTTRAKLPMGIAQVGKSFRNEITPGNFIFRTREFEQMEIEFFTSEKDSGKWFDYYLNKYQDFFGKLGISKDNFEIEEISKDELAHYSTRTVDFLYDFPFGKDEIMGIANRTNFDLNAHAEHSKSDMTYLDPFTNERYVPHVIEPSIGVERLMLAVLSESYNEEDNDGETRIVMNLPFTLSPQQVVVMPLTNKLDAQARELFENLIDNTDLRISYDKSGSIGKRYRRQDSIGSYYCVTFDFDSIEDKKVTVRNRDTMEQERVSIENLGTYLRG